MYPSYWCMYCFVNAHPTHHSFLVIGFITLVAPVTGVATLGFSIAMEESTTGNGSASSLLDLYNFYLEVLLHLW